MAILTFNVCNVCNAFDFEIRSLCRLQSSFLFGSFIYNILFHLLILLEWRYLVTFLFFRVMKDISPHNKMNSAETPVTFDFDIVERFPEEICRNVFSYLTFNELLSASLVSKDWYGLIGRAPECMKKLTVINSFESE